jgi:hypothetical protein
MHCDLPAPDHQSEQDVTAKRPLVRRDSIAFAVFSRQIDEGLAELEARWAHVAAPAASHRLQRAYLLR